MTRTSITTLVCISVLLTAARAGAAETRTYEVFLKGKRVGTAVLSVREDTRGVTTFAHHSRLRATRNGVSSERVLHEEVRSRDGVFISAWAVRITGDQKSAVSAWWDARAGVVVVRRGESIERIPTGNVAGVETLFDAPRRLIQNGALGARRRVFDLPDGRVGWVVLKSPRDENGWAVTEELGIRVRSRWAPGARLPDALSLPDVGLRYTAVGIESGADLSRIADLTGGVVTVRGKLERGSRVRLTPASGWPGLSCAGGEARLTASGAICRPSSGSGEVSRIAVGAGPRVRALVKSVKQGGDVIARAAVLSVAIESRLSPRVDGAGLWEANPEVALGRGSGDCNEAVAVFLAAAPLMGIDARRRAGLVLDPRDPDRLWPHAWVEVNHQGKWVRVDPSRAEAPATGIYLDVGDGATIAGRLRAVAPALHGARVEVVSRSGSAVTSNAR